jgi:hypothetical protein
MAKRKLKPNIYSALKLYGAPFFDPPKSDLTLEETIIYSLKFSIKPGYPLVTNVLPYILAINSKQLKIEMLLKKIRTNRDKQLVGYFADVANKFLPSKKLRTIREELYRDNFKKLNVTNQKRIGKFLRLAIEHSKQPIAKKWNILILGDESNYYIRFRKWYSAIH